MTKTQHHNQSKAFQKYFRSYAWNETLSLASILEHRTYDRVVVVPARRESESFKHLLSSLEAASRGQSVLCILVVNASEDSGDLVHQDNAFMLDDLRRGPITALSEQNACFLVKRATLDVFVINRAEAPHFFPKREGVGLARKIGCDLAAYLIAKECVRNDFIYTTDADAKVPEKYFHLIPNPSRAVAYVFPFSHDADSIHESYKLPLRIYELYLNYYKSGLRFAGSPYAFHTIGSTMALRASSYIEARGFPTKEAGEDFYLLNKLRKLGPVKELDTGTIQLSGRLSDRVPFGTGASVKKFAVELQSGNDVLFYDPEVFWALKTLIHSFDELPKHRSIEMWRSSLLKDDRRGPWIMQWADEAKVDGVLEDLINRSSDPSSISHGILVWFDAFKTLKFIHRLRDSFVPSIPWFEALQRSPYETSGRSPKKPLSDWREDRKIR